MMRFYFLQVIYNSAAGADITSASLLKLTGSTTVLLCYSLLLQAPGSAPTDPSQHPSKPPPPDVRCLPHKVTLEGVVPAQLQVEGSWLPLPHPWVTWGEGLFPSKLHFKRGRASRI